MNNKTVMTVGFLALAGLLIYKFMNPTAPPLIVSGWNAGNATWAIGGASGALSTASAGSTVTAGPYQLQIDAYDGTGYNILILQGAKILNSVYVTGNGSFS
jgi:hypothetical protein